MLIVDDSVVARSVLGRMVDERTVELQKAVADLTLFTSAISRRSAAGFVTVSGVCASRGIAAMYSSSFSSDSPDRRIFPSDPA